ncbi:MAG: hypothetical protein V1690_02575 [Candidatus Moraniibacteriota bacterium]
MQNKKIITILEGAFVWVFLVFVSGFVGTWYLFQLVDKGEQTLDAARADYQTSLKQLDSFDMIKSNFESTKSIKDETESMVVKPESTLSLIEELEKAAGVSGVILKTDVGEKPGTTKKIVTKLGQLPASGSANGNTNAAEQEVWLELTVEGDYANILKFIRYLENAPKLIAVSSVNINQASTMSAADALENAEGILGYLKAIILVTNVF